MSKYDRSREAAFPTYAQYRIRGAILDYLRRCDWLPRSVRQRTHDIEQATVELERKLGRAPEAEEIAAALGMTLDEYAQTVSSVGTTSLVPAADLGFGKGEEALSGDDILSDGGESGPMSKVLRKEKVEILARAIEQLPEKERIVVSFYYFEGLTMREMATALRLTEGRISQLHSQAMLRLRGTLSGLHQEKLLC
jgi:RNA polymerase sigma factor for flagellar operon FliA